MRTPYARARAGAAGLFRVFRQTTQIIFISPQPERTHIDSVILSFGLLGDGSHESLFLFESGCCCNAFILFVCICVCVLRAFSF